MSVAEPVFDHTEAVDRVIFWSSHEPQDPPPRPIVPRRDPLIRRRRRRAPFAWSPLRTALRALAVKR